MQTVSPRVDDKVTLDRPPLWGWVFIEESQVDRAQDMKFVNGSMRQGWRMDGTDRDNRRVRTFFEREACMTILEHQTA